MVLSLLVDQSFARLKGSFMVRSTSLNQYTFVRFSPILLFQKPHLDVVQYSQAIVGDTHLVSKDVLRLVYRRHAQSVVRGPSFNKQAKQPTASTSRYESRISLRHTNRQALSKGRPDRSVD